MLGPSLTNHQELDNLKRRLQSAYEYLSKLETRIKELESKMSTTHHEKDITTVPTVQKPS